MFSLQKEEDVRVRTLEPNDNMSLFIPRTYGEGNAVNTTCEEVETCGLQSEAKRVVMVNALRSKMPLRLVSVPMPIPQHRRKRWMSEAYHQRTQKKWNKRFTGRTHLVSENRMALPEDGTSMQKIAERIKAKTKAHYGL